jgi:hypothetical protein
MAKGIKNENKKRMNSKTGRAAIFGRYKVTAKEEWKV